MQRKERCVASLSSKGKVLKDTPDQKFVVKYTCFALNAQIQLFVNFI